MKCPICEDVRMREVDKNGVHIDVCPDCKGVWLDRGELDRLMTGVREVRQEYNDLYRDENTDGYNDNRKYDDRNSSDYKNHKHKKKKNSVLDVLSDLF
ncbi:zf-TFIIB domain-containing protein [Paenibacillus crassostreae]|uniref:Cytoplasmic protein n=1 Tax=Paenibacillus crassostreae TaxID=1763538 RepID=A0A162RK28_9BACL|nr:zf-TFIIB domain-containing protein [Paenibacillus crassostreae]AOZ92597.1 cytoplasmic protein [Paenibacillus crassostreae]OAB72547.1 cytoplasmic protein [Paenibacillus crassostreae]